MIFNALKIWSYYFSTLSSPNMNRYQIVLLPAKGEENGVDSQNLAWVSSKNGDWDKNLSQILSIWELIPEDQVQKKMK